MPDPEPTGSGIGFRRKRTSANPHPGVIQIPGASKVPMNQTTPFRSAYVPPARKVPSLLSRITDNVLERLSTMFDFLAILLKVVLSLLAVAAIIALGAILFAFPIMWLWNYVVPYEFHGVPELDFWHAWALGTLCGILFKSSSSSSSSSKS